MKYTEEMHVHVIVAFCGNYYNIGPSLLYVRCEWSKHKKPKKQVKFDPFRNNYKKHISVKNFKAERKTINGYTAVYVNFVNGIAHFPVFCRETIVHMY